MKSTIKIDLESQNYGSTPVIKIIQPSEFLDENSPDFDVRDQMIRDFLHHPSNIERNGWFELSTHFTHEVTGIHVTKITPVKEPDILYKIRHAVLNRLVPYNSIVELNSCSQVAIKNKKDGKSPMPLRGDLYFKIHEFFDWVEKTGYCSYEDQTPYLEHKYQETTSISIRHIFETMLSQEERMSAFNNTPKYKWDSRVDNAYQGINEAFDWTTSPQGFDYWTKVAEKLK